MSTINDGGQAFPVPGLSPLPNNEFIYPMTGMSLRDYFAGQALSTLAGYSAEDLATWSADNFAAHAYAVADSMLRARGAA